MNNIPVYRGEVVEPEDGLWEHQRKLLTKIGDKFYAVGYLVGPDKIIIGEVCPTSMGAIQLPENMKWFRIDPTTLSIHHSDMIDSEGNKIFASLSEDGRGGDKIDFRDVEHIAYVHEGQANISEYEYLSKGTYDVNSTKTLVQLRKLIKAIGVQE